MSWAAGFSGDRLLSMLKFLAIEPHLLHGAGMALVPLRCRRVTVVMLGTVVWAAQVLPARAQEMDGLRDFLINRPIIERCIAQKRMFSTRIPEAARDQTFFIRAQPGAYYMQVIGSLDDIDQLGFVYGGMISNTVWEVHAGTLCVLDPRHNPDIDRRKNAPVYSHDLLVQGTISTILGLGLNHERALSWEGNNLRAFVVDGTPVHGTLTKSGAGFVKLSLNAEGSADSYSEIHYEFDPAFQSAELPVAFTRFNRRGAGDFSKAFSVRFIELVESKSALETAFFQPTRFISHSNHTDHSLYYSNHVMMHVVDGRPEPVISLAEAASQLDPASGRARRGLVLPVLIVPSILLLGALVMGKRNKESKHIKA